MASRVYTVSFSSSAQAGAVDWFELAAGASRSIALLGLDIAQTTELGETAEEQIGWTVKRAAGSFTSGSGGNTGVARPPVVSTEGAAVFTAETLNTTQAAVGAGTLTTVHQAAFNVRVGLQMWWTPETIIAASVSETLVVGMSAAPVDSITWIGTAYVAELN
jgi:hypothetical protein